MFHCTEKKINKMRLIVFSILCFLASAIAMSHGVLSVRVISVIQPLITLGFSESGTRINEGKCRQAFVSFSSCQWPEGRMVRHSDKGIQNYIVIWLGDWTLDDLEEWEGNIDASLLAEAEVDVKGDPLLSFNGPQMRTVQSSDTLAIIWGYFGFQDTQFTVRVWPDKTATGRSFLIL